MSNYRRLYAPGGTYFFTVVTAARQPLLAEPRNVDLLRHAFRYVRQRRPFELVAIVVLPDHLHCLWQLPEGGTDYSTRWQMIKTAFTRKWTGVPGNERSKSVWQPRFWEHLIRDEEDLRRHLDYIHFNPVKHGLTANPGEWEASSFQRFVGNGWYPADWGGCEPENIKKMMME